MYTWQEIYFLLNQTYRPTANSLLKYFAVYCIFRDVPCSIFYLVISIAASNHYVIRRFSWMNIQYQLAISMWNTQPSKWSLEFGVKFWWWPHPCHVDFLCNNKTNVYFLSFCNNKTAQAAASSKETVMAIGAPATQRVRASVLGTTSNFFQPNARDPPRTRLKTRTSRFRLPSTGDPCIIHKKLDPSSSNANSIMWTHTSLEININFKITRSYFEWR